ncbi:Do family serine endopeptidase [Paenalcaligenes sp. Me131]
MQVIRSGYQKLAAPLAAVAAGLAVAMVTPQAFAEAEASRPVPTISLPDFSSIVEKTEKSVVNIRTTEIVPVYQGAGGEGDPYDLFRWFFGPDMAPPGMAPPQQRGAPRQAVPPQQRERVVPRGVGSGFIISDDGYILTNNHVVADANDIFVTMTDGKEYKATVVGRDERTDVALIKIEAKSLPSLVIGDPGALKKGEWVVAIGSPFGLDSTVTVGVVSAINRDTGDYLPFIQTDVAVNPGNSGGPLLNLHGEVVGMNSQIVSRSGGFMGISLAIPIDEVMQVVAQLKEHGKVTRGRIGVQITQVDEGVAKALGLEDGKGALVSAVEPDGPAAKAGIRSGDVILKFGDRRVEQMSDLPRIVGAVKPGTEVPVEVWRKGKSMTVKATVEEIPGAPATSDTNTPAPSNVDRLGLSVKAMSKAEAEQLGLETGVIVAEASGAAAETGIMEGDVIVRINDQDIDSPSQYNKVVKALAKGKAAAVLVVRDSNSQWVLITPEE